MNSAYLCVPLRLGGKCRVKSNNRRVAEECRDNAEKISKSRALPSKREIWTLLISAQILSHCARDRLARLRLVVAERGAGVYLETVDVILGRDL